MLVAKKETKSFNNTKKEKINRIKKKNKPQRPKKEFSFKVKIFFYATIVLAICLVVLLRYAHMSQLQYDLLSLNKDIIELKEEKQGLILELERIKESGLIEKRAKEELGMQYPTKEQIVFVSVGDIEAEEKTEVQVAEKNQSGFVFLKSFRNVFTKVLNWLE